MGEWVRYERLWATWQLTEEQSASFRDATFTWNGDGGALSSHTQPRRIEHTSKDAKLFSLVCQPPWAFSKECGNTRTHTS